MPELAKTAESAYSSAGSANVDENTDRAQPLNKYRLVPNGPDSRAEKCIRSRFGMSSFESRL